MSITCHVAPCRAASETRHCLCLPRSLPGLDPKSVLPCLPPPACRPVGTTGLASRPTRPPWPTRRPSPAPPPPARPSACAGGCAPGASQLSCLLRTASTSLRNPPALVAPPPACSSQCVATLGLLTCSTDGSAEGAIRPAAPPAGVCKTQTGCTTAQSCDTSECTVLSQVGVGEELGSWRCRGP